MEPTSQVCVYTIALNEEQFVDRWMDSVGSADAVVVLDTGSTDKTVKKLQSRGAIVHQQVVKPWRFDVARNLSIADCPAGCDILFSVDLDEEIVEPDWKERILSVWKPEHKRGRYTYVWNHNPDGSEGKTFNYEKIHTRDYEWHYPCHEILRRRTPGEDNWVNIDIKVEHYADETKSRRSYLGLLRLSVEESPEDAWALYHYGRELFFTHQPDECIAVLKKYLDLHPKDWHGFRYHASSMIAKCFEMLQKDSDAESWHFRACAEAPFLREPYIEAARFYNVRNRFPMGWAMAKRAMQIDQKPRSCITAQDWEYAPYDSASVAAYYIGMKPESLAHARKAHQLAPWDDRIKSNLEIVERMSSEEAGHFVIPDGIQKDPWSARPSFGLVISTFGSVPYVHLALAVRRRFYPEVPAIVIDDCSPVNCELAALAHRYQADFYSNEERFNHTRGDMMSIISGLVWAAVRQVDVMVKMSRRFVPKEDWRPSLRDIIGKTSHATYAGIFDGTWSLRSECIGLHVERWLPHTGDLKTRAIAAQSLWVERIIYDKAREILTWGVGGHPGVAIWGFPGLGKWIKTDSHLWHDTADPTEYCNLARSLGLAYRPEDFDEKHDGQP